MRRLATPLVPIAIERWPPCHKKLTSSLSLFGLRLLSQGRLSGFSQWIGHKLGGDGCTSWLRYAGDAGVRVSTRLERLLMQQPEVSGRASYFVLALPTARPSRVKGGDQLFAHRSKREFGTEDIAVTQVTAARTSYM